MATLDPTPYPLPDIDYGSGKWQHDIRAGMKAHEDAFKALQEKSNALPEGEIVGALLRWQRADGFAFYLVTKGRPLTLQWVPFMDAWTVEQALIRGLNAADVHNMVRRERSLNALFKRS